MATKKVAETAKEFLEKYKSKRYTAENAGLCIILNYLYITLKSRASDDEAKELPDKLYTSERMDAILLKAYSGSTDRGLALIASMETLVGWLVTAYDAAWAGRMAAIMSTNTAMAHITSLKAISKHLHSANAKSLGLLNPVEDEFYQDLTGQGEEILEAYNATREYIINSLCYVNAYNTLMDMIGAELLIPEFYVFKINTGAITATLDMLTEKLEQYETLSEKAKYLDVNTSPIPIVPKEIPEENLKAARLYVHLATLGSEAWSTPLLKITKNYWRRMIANG